MAEHRYSKVNTNPLWWNPPRRRSPAVLWWLALWARYGMWGLLMLGAGALVVLRVLFWVALAAVLAVSLLALYQFVPLLF